MYRATFLSARAASAELTDVQARTVEEHADPPGELPHAAGRGASNVEAQRRGTQSRKNTAKIAFNCITRVQLFTCELVLCKRRGVLGEPRVCVGVEQVEAAEHFTIVKAPFIRSALVRLDLARLDAALTMTSESWAPTPEQMHAFL